MLQAALFCYGNTSIFTANNQGGLHNCQLYTPEM